MVIIIFNNPKANYKVSMSKERKKKKDKPRHLVSFIQSQFSQCANTNHYEMRHIFVLNKFIFINQESIIKKYDSEI
jgi:hypothetical protein